MTYMYIYMYIPNMTACVVASYQDSATALDCASWYGHLQVVRLLLGRESEVECGDKVR